MAKKRHIAVQMQIDQPFKRHIGLFAGIHEYAQASDNWDLVVDKRADHTLPSRADKPSPYDGLIGRISPQGARRAKRLAVPAVNVQFSSPVRSPVRDLPGVYADHVESGRLQAEHLLARGFQNFGVLCEDKRGSLTESKAFEREIREAKCKQFSKLMLTSEEGNHNRGEMSYSEWKRAMLKIDRWMDTAAHAMQFDLGQLFATPGVLGALEESRETSASLIAFHSSGDCGNLCEEMAVGYCRPISSRLAKESG